MLEENLLRAPVIDCDDHDRALSAAPQSRHHSQAFLKNHYKYQINNQIDGMMHNHPSGDPAPSRADIEMTKAIAAAAKPLGVAIHDHLVIGRTGHASFRELGLL